MIKRHSGSSTGVRATKGEEIDNEDFGRKKGRACDVCGNEYDKPLEIVVNGISKYFDCFECAIHELAPTCEHCGCRIIGHGVEAGGAFFCCVHCASQKGVVSLKDRA